jgi:hypothetical protein
MKIVNNNYYSDIYLFFKFYSCITSRSYSVLSLSALSTPTPLDDLEGCSEYFWEGEESEESDKSDESNDEDDRKSGENDEGEEGDD